MRQCQLRHCGVLFLVWTIPAIAQQVRTIALTGQPAPGITDSYYSTIGYPVLNNVGQVAFPAVLSGTGVTLSNNESIWSEGTGSLAIVREAATKHRVNR